MAGQGRSSAGPRPDRGPGACRRAFDPFQEEAWDRVRQDHDGTVTFGIAYVKIDDIVTILDELKQALDAHR
ncbi:hypothetical protein [Streptomyces sp. NPDC101455]|uniref:hypothetical protein n=1 Tax=Streptomyces sp. NPDC101455 TaxID=3366142 RepID=UPI00380C3851